jgi:hypothetical protein
MIGPQLVVLPRRGAGAFATTLALSDGTAVFIAGALKSTFSAELDKLWALAGAARNNEPIRTSPDTLFNIVSPLQTTDFTPISYRNPTTLEARETGARRCRPGARDFS